MNLYSTQDGKLQLQQLAAGDGGRIYDISLGGPGFHPVDRRCVAPLGMARLA